MSDQNSKITQAITNHESTNTPLKNKCKSHDQLSTEKSKPHKVSNLNVELPLLSLDSDSSVTSHMSFSTNMEFATGARPKPIRVPIVKLNSIECAAAFSTRQAIVKKDAIHHHIDPTALTLKKVINIISDRFLNKGFIFTKGLDNHFKEFFISLLTNDDETNTKVITIESEDFTNFCNTIYVIKSSLIMSMTPFKDVTGDLFDEAVNSIATDFTNNVGPVFVAYTDCIVSFIITPPRQNPAIIGANFEQIW